MPEGDGDHPVGLSRSMRVANRGRDCVGYALAPILAVSVGTWRKLGVSRRVSAQAGLGVCRKGEHHVVGISRRDRPG